MIATPATVTRTSPQDMLKDLQNNPQMMGQTVNMPGGTDLGTVALGEAVDTAEVVPGQINQMQKVVGTLANIPWVKLIVSFLVFFRALLEEGSVRRISIPETSSS